MNKRGSQVRSALPWLGQKKGLSGVVAALLLILLAVALIGIIWGVVDNLIKKEIEKTSCLDTVGKVVFSNNYVCYNASNGSQLRFGISIGDIEIKEVFISVFGDGMQKSFKITDENTTINYIRPYNGNYGDPIILPGKNSGLSYVYNMSEAGFSEGPDSIEISPVTGGNTCSATDSVREIIGCYALV